MMKRFLTILIIFSLLAGCGPTVDPPASEDWMYYPPNKDYFSYHAVPVSKSSDGRFYTLNYVARSAAQVGGMCYNYAKFHTFQTYNAYIRDMDFGSQDRSIRLAMGPYFQCHDDELIEEFIRDTGMVEFCVEPFGVYPFGENECGFCDRYNLDYVGDERGWPLNCSPIQTEYKKPIIYKASGFSASRIPRHLEDRKNFLANSLLKKGPGTIVLIWAPEHVREMSEPEFILANNVVVLRADCSLRPERRPKESHAVSLIGFDFRNPDKPYFYIQNSIGVSQVVYKLDYYSWANDCSFGTGLFEYYTGIEDIVYENPFKDFCE